MHVGHVLHRTQIDLGKGALAAAVAAGRLTRVARGWYATPGADPDISRALRLGGRLTCLSAARHRGLWTLSDRSLHVALRRPDRVPPTVGAVFHRLATEGWGTREAVMPLSVCLDHALRHHSVEAGLTVLESAVEQRHLSPWDAQRLIEAQHQRKRSSGLQHSDPGAASGSETRVRLWRREGLNPCPSCRACFYPGGTARRAGVRAAAPFGPPVAGMRRSQTWNRGSLSSGEAKEEDGADHDRAG